SKRWTRDRGGGGHSLRRTVSDRDVATEPTGMYSRRVRRDEYPPPTWFDSVFDLERPHALRPSRQHDIRRVHREDAVADPPNDVVDARLERGCVAQVDTVHIEDHVAVVGDDALPVHRPSAERDQRARRESARHRNHFDRQWVRAELPHQLAVVDDADES